MQKLHDSLTTLLDQGRANAQTSTFRAEQTRCGAQNARQQCRICHLRAPIMELKLRPSPELQCNA
jgi:hypothetical protein